MCESRFNYSYAILVSVIVKHIKHTFDHQMCANLKHILNGRDYIQIQSHVCELQQ